MIKHASGLAAGLLLLALAPAASASGEPNVVPAILASTVIIDSADGTGAGFVVGPQQVVTAAHVVAGSTQVIVREGTARLPGHVIRADSTADLALVSAAVTAKPLTLATSLPTPGAAVFAVGNPLGEGLSASRGIVSGIHEANGRQSVLTDAAINPGNSGGPLVGLDGRVVGLVVSKQKNAEGMAQAVSATDVSVFLRGGGQPAAATPATPAAHRTSPDHGPWVPVALAVLGCVAIGLTLRSRRPTPVPEVEIVLHPARPSTTP